MEGQQYTIVHADFFVRSMKASLEFYCRKLGFNVVDDTFVKGAMVRSLSNDAYDELRLVLLRVSLEGAMLELQEFQLDSALTGEATPVALQTGVVSILVRDLSAHIDSLQGKGILPSSAVFSVELPRQGSCRAVFYRDPDGNRLEFLEMQT